MSEAASQELAPTLVKDTISIARLHGLACIDCGAVCRCLTPAGQVVHRGRVWSIVACPLHITRHDRPRVTVTS